MAYKIQDKRNPLCPAYNMVPVLLKICGKGSSLSFSLEKSNGDHKPGQHIKAVKRITRNINLFPIQFSLNCFTEAQWLQRHHKLLMAKTMLCPTLPAIFTSPFSALSSLAPGITQSNCSTC